MNEQMNEDGFFTEEAYAAATDLANTFGPIIRDITNGDEPDWFSASFDVAKARTHKMLLGDIATPYHEARWAGFLLLDPLVKAREKSMTKWLEYVEAVRDAFPAFEADVVRGYRPDYNKAEAEAVAYLRYSGKRAA